VDFKVLGCHGGESPKHQCPAFLVDGKLCIDAGSITNMLTLKQQQKLEAVVVDPASNWPLFAEKARELLQKQKVAVFA